MPFQKLSIELKYCYGIGSLKAELEADANGSFAIYAPNGTMKTSLSRTLADFAAGLDPQDEMYPDRKSIRKIITDKGASLEAHEILVVPPYEESFQRSDRVSTLLVNPKLRDRYQDIEATLDAKRDKFRKAMQKACGKRREVEEEISLAFLGKKDGFLEALRRVRPEVEETDEAPFASLPYGDVFNEKVEELLTQRDVHDIIKDYIERLNNLLDDSQFFSRETFSYYGADQVAAALQKHGFFEANHAVELVGSEVEGGGRQTRRIETKDELATLVQEEKDQIAADSELRAKYAKLGDKLSSSQAMRDFKKCLDAHPELIPRLAEYRALKQEVWTSYFVANKDTFLELTDAYEGAKADRAKIQEQAKSESTQWENVIRVFNQRFSVPFRLEARNHIDLVLGRVDAMELSFRFKDEEGEFVEVDRDRLLNSLSQGERRAMYLLDVLFEVEARKKEGTPTLFVFDDVADSFDYKNKYAILRYLEEIKAWPDGRMIILTHNFDFLRSVHGSVVHRKKCQIAIREGGSISLQPIEGINNIFTNDWKKRFFEDNCKRIASIPFMRNLVEYLWGLDDGNYVTLTSLMHWKDDTPSIKNSDLDKLYNDLFGTDGAWKEPDEPVFNLIMASAGQCLESPVGAEFHTKVVLAMASRLLADRYMLEKMGAEALHMDIESNQTRRLFNKFIEMHGDDHPAYDALHRTILITPEQLHLNAFMYEPIIDVSAIELKDLYADLKELAGQ